MAQTQKDKIAAANTGKQLTDDTRAKISRSMAKYWASLPYKPATEDTSAATGQTTPPPALTNPYQED